MKILLLFLSFLFPHLLSAQLQVVETKKTIVISNGESHVLTYHKAMVDPPEGIDKVYRRSGFIHPLTAPNGGVVTGIHPKDHAHHLGLWHAWVKTKHKGRSIDFWNLKARQGTVRYARTEELRDEKNSVGFTVVQEHVILPDEVILEEGFSIDVSIKDGHTIVDYTTVQENISDANLELPAYRYGGPLAYRAPHDWNKENSTLLTSEGKSRKDGHATRARWCRFSGPSANGKVTLTMLGHPKNHDAPQRQRIWPPTSHNGAIFYNWVPTQEHDWVIKPSDVSTMRYRLILSEGTPDKESIEAWFKDFK